MCGSYLKVMLDNLGNALFMRDALKGHTVSKNGSISFFFFSSSYTQIGTLIYS